LLQAKNSYLLENSWSKIFTKIESSMITYKSKGMSFAPIFAKRMNVRSKNGLSVVVYESLEDDMDVIFWWLDMNGMKIR